ncbi:NAD(P)H-quinone oxidoreductase chain 4 chloroplastic [Bienertia sinuspersici]
MGTSYDRIRLVYLDEMGGIGIPMPKVFTFFSNFSMASLALLVKILITFGMAIGIILTPNLFITMSCQMFYGYKLFNITNSSFLILDHMSCLFRLLFFYQ